MALSVGNYVLLAVGAALLVTGAARVALYVIPPEPTPHSVYQWSPNPFQAPVGGQAALQGSASPAPAQPSGANTGAEVPGPPLIQAAPQAVAAAASQSPASPAPSAAPPSQETDIAAVAAAAPVAEAMAPLGDRFVRVWHWVQETGEFIYYDPLAPEESTLKAMASGKTYLILVTESVNVLVNGQHLEFVCENGDCWNRVVWP